MWRLLERERMRCAEQCVSRGFFGMCSVIRNRPAATNLIFACGAVRPAKPVEWFACTAADGSYDWGIAPRNPIYGKIIGMTVQATKRKVKRSFTLTPESLAFVHETRCRRRASSDSEALDLLLKEQMLAARRQEIDAAFEAYYDNASEEELQEQRQWAEGTAGNMWIGIPE